MVTWKRAMTGSLGWGSLVLASWACGAEARWSGEALEGAGEEEFRYEVVPAFPARTFREPVMTIPYRADGARWVLVLGLKGEMWSVPADQPGGDPHLALHLARHLAEAAGGEERKVGMTLMGARFDREFPARPYLYVRYSVRGTSPPLTKLSRFEVLERAPLKLGERVEILEWPSNGHDGGDLCWGPRDGYLYVSAGDGSAPGDPGNIGQRVDEIRGSILRIDVHGSEGARLYRIPNDNPFLGMDGVRPELWCYGLRNPWRMAFDPESGELWLGDNGDEQWELVHGVVRGANYGWSAFEGSHVFRAGNALGGPVRELTPPLIEHPHSEMRSVIGGLFYQGKELPELRGHYLYGCYFTKRLWAVSRAGGKPGTPVQIAEAGGAVVSLDADEDGDFYVTCLDGTISRLRRKTGRAPARPWPERLSDTGLFSDVATQEPAPGVVRYLTNAVAWADGATTERFLAIPDGPRLRAHGGQEGAKSWEFPTGTALARTCSVGARRVETQLLYYDGRWRGFSYRWNAEGTEAWLVGPERREEEIELPSGERQRWSYPSRAECLTCHTQRTNFAIAVTTPQLDRDGPHGGNQIEWLLQAGYLEDHANLRQLRGRPATDPRNADLPLEARARSYLEVNCAHCHREAGLGGRAGFELMASLSLEAMRVVNVKAVVGLGAGPGALVVAPGSPERSELLARMARRGPGQMPLLGSHVVDEEGVALIRDWIRSLASEEP